VSRRIYVIGSLRNPELIETSSALRGHGHEVFDNWHAVGPEADDHWRDYHHKRGHTMLEALRSPEAVHTYELDRRWLEWCDTTVLVLPAGRSAHMELGWAAGAGKDTFVLLETEDPERWDVMYQFATGVYADFAELLEVLA
jgi:hypothetical protein